MDCESLIKWFKNGKRDLPWRENPSPYAVWISEVMLQQTQVAVVVPYFERWMRRFPTIRDLSQASLDEVIKLWEGLGYYSRARNLHEAAQLLVDRYDGELPRAKEELAKIKGLGPYTIGAILSFAFHEKVAAIDGNVLRVATRYFGLEEDISKQRTVATIRERVEESLPDEEHWVVNEALIELGAILCQKKPKCQQCPLRKGCKAHIQGVTDRIPLKSAKVKSTPLYRAVAVIQCGDQFLLRRGEKGKVMSDLHEFPYIETKEGGLELEAFKSRLGERFGIEVRAMRELSTVSHTFTRYRVRLYPVHFEVEKCSLVGGYQWFSRGEIANLAFSSGHRRIFQYFHVFP